MPSQVAQTVKNLSAMQETQVQSLGQEDPLEKGMGIPTPVFLPEELQGQRSLVGYSPWGHKELDVTEHAHIHTYMQMYSIYYITESLYCIPETNTVL